MNGEKNHLAYWLPKFLSEELISNRNFSINTQKSYRDTFLLFIEFMGKKRNIDITKLKLEHINSCNVKTFLDELEQNRKCSISTRNQRLTVIKSFCKFVAQNYLERSDFATQIINIYSKRKIIPNIDYLTREEVNKLLLIPNQYKNLGIRNYAILLFMYNTGARVSEVANVKIIDLSLDQEHKTVKLHGKGKKDRICPLWDDTVQALTNLISSSTTKDNEYLFTGIRNNKITRHGIYEIISSIIKEGKKRIPSLCKKNISPHSFRHTTAIHLLQAGVDISTISSWLGHSSLETTNQYIRIDLEMKEKAIKKCSIATEQTIPVWQSDEKLLKYLKSL